jgi:hypothetical protein
MQTWLQRELGKIREMPSMVRDRAALENKLYQADLKGDEEGKEKVLLALKRLDDISQKSRENTDNLLCNSEGNNSCTEKATRGRPKKKDNEKNILIRASLPPNIKMRMDRIIESRRENLPDSVKKENLKIREEKKHTGKVKGEWGYGKVISHLFEKMELLQRDYLIQRDNILKKVDKIISYYKSLSKNDELAVGVGREKLSLVIGQEIRELLVSLSNMNYDEPSRWDELFGEEGRKKLQEILRIKSVVCGAN